MIEDNVKIIARVFPRKTKATPDDALAFTAPPPKAFLQSLESGRQELDEVHISVAFSYDMPKAEQLADAWRRIGVPVSMGGPAFNNPGGAFVPGRYLKTGYVITSRGCVNNCWFCAVPKREGALRELPVTDGNNLLDDNILACSEEHIREVFAMLKRQKERPLLTGGLEARRLRQWHIDLIREARVQRMYFAYDTDSDYEPLIAAGRLLAENGITGKSRKAYCYVLIGFDGDTFDAAEKRLRATWAAGFIPFAMLYKDASGETDADWRKFQREWVRIPIIMSNLREPQKERGLKGEVL